jgi:hypothetical protein
MSPFSAFLTVCFVLPDMGRRFVVANAFRGHRKLVRISPRRTAGGVQGRPGELNDPRALRWSSCAFILTAWSYRTPTLSNRAGESLRTQTRTRTVVRLLLNKRPRPAVRTVLRRFVISVCLRFL